MITLMFRIESVGVHRGMELDGFLNTSSAKLIPEFKGFSGAQGGFVISF